jgi:hypothetical protein
MDDRGDLAGLQRHLDSLTEEERSELEAFVERFNNQLNAKIEQLLYELQDPSGLSTEALEMRARLSDGHAPLIDDDGQLIYKPRSELSIQDMQRFAAFMDWDRERRERALRGPGQESEN